jgi:uncharacterized protein (TIGR02246 family)
MRFSRFAIASLVLIATPAAANPQDRAINTVYQRLAAARAAGDVPGMASAFAPGALLIDARPRPALSGAELAGQLRPMAERLRADNARVETAYRVERRSVMGAIALDAGYMRQDVRRADGGAMTRYARFLVTMQRGPDGVWRIIGDASMTVDEAAWTSLARTEGLHFDG